MKKTSAHFGRSSRRPRLHDEVSRALLAMMRRGELAVGERLPPEPELAEAFQVSRGTLRAAVQELTLLGFLEVRQGAGTFVRHPDKYDLAQPFQVLLASKPQLAGDLLQLRHLLEPEIARLAALTCDPADAERLQALVEEQDQLARNGSRLAKEDLQFHHEIAKIAGNSLVTNILEMMYQLLQEQGYQGSKATETETVKQHRAIVQAISQQDGEAAKHAMSIHLAWVEQVLKDKGMPV
jgi:GntR family transcriptional regulator, transcriptional repressor for pyruvate dehydrogenase complex